MQVALVDGQLTAYHLSGKAQAPVVVLLHGLGAIGSTYRGVVERLRDRFRLLVPDLLGSGQTAKPASGYSPRDLAAHLAALLTQLGIGQVRAVVGHSQGAVVAVELCKRVPSERLVLLDPPPVNGLRWLRPVTTISMGASAELLSALLPHRAIAKLWLKFLYADGGRLTEEVLDAYTTNAGERGYANATAQALHALARLQLDLDGAPPTLLLWGAEDRLFPPRLAQGWRERLAHSELTVLPATGHCPHEERPATVAQALGSFLALPA